MKQSGKTDAGLDQLLSTLTQQLREAVRLGIQEGLELGLKKMPAPTAPHARAAPRVKNADALCQVPTCKRAVVARGLCQTHYSKARRMGFDEEQLNAEQLNTLSRDGRKNRFSGV